MKTSKLLTTTVAALTVVGAGLVFAQTNPPGTTPPMTAPEPTNQATPAAPPAGTMTTPSQDTTQRAPAAPMTTDAQADRN